MDDRVNVLVIDDQRIIGDLFEITLGYRGHLITFVDKAADVPEVILKNAFDVVFLDIVMPEKDGVAVLQEIREISPHLPVVMMTGYAVQEKKEEAQRLGAVACLKKPFEYEDIREAVKKASGKDIG